MKKYFAGIDSGSSMCKAVLFDGNAIADMYAAKTGWNTGQCTQECLGVLLERNALSRDEVVICVTGYGRESVDCADCLFTEIMCHAYGGMYLASGIQGVIDIGGQDSKVIQIRNSKVANFLMNDKCASGTGRFLSMACDTLGVPLESIDNVADLSEAIPITSMCTVFAESEIIGLRALQKDRSKILTGVLRSIANKIMQMTGKINFTGQAPILMTGGLSRSKALITTITQITGLTVITHEHAVFAGAIGACICAERRHGGLPKYA